jgi:2-phosphosulfolactate phosphatase
VTRPHQQPYRVKLTWGRRGAAEAAGRGEVLVIVDTLSFSTAVATAVQHGALVYPCGEQEDRAPIAKRIGGEAAVGRQEVPEKGRFSLSPLTYVGVEPGTKVVLASPNGATCSRCGRDVPHLFVAALVNAEAAASAVNRLLETTGLSATVVACGERWKTPSEEGWLRMAVEDYLAAGAILSHIGNGESPEARVCAGAFGQAAGDLAELLWECESGRELREMGFGEDVAHAARLNCYDAVPAMRGGFLAALG